MNQQNRPPRYGNQSSGIELGQSRRYSNFETADTVTISKVDLLDLQRKRHTRSNLLLIRSRYRNTIFLH